MYLSDCGLSENSWVDVYVEGTFKCFQIQTKSSITVEKGWPVLIRLRPNLREELTDCPGLDDHVEKQSKGCSKGKWPAEMLISPLKNTKVPRHSLNSDTSQSHQVMQLYQCSPSPPLPDLSEPFSHSDTGPSAAAMQKSGPFKSTKTQSKPNMKGKAKRTIDRWPNDFYVSEIADSLHELKVMKDAD